MPTVSFPTIPDEAPAYIAELVKLHPGLANVNQIALSTSLAQLSLTNTEFTQAIFSPHSEFFPWVAGFPGDPANGKWFGAAVLNGDLPWCIKDKHNNFIDINAYKPATDGKISRKNECFAACHLIVIDDVGTKVKKISINLQPSYIFETSPGNCQYGYILAIPVTDPVLIARVFTALIVAGLNDPGMNTLARYVRLPVGVNSKQKYVEKLGAPFVQVVHEWQPTRRYTIDEIISGFDLDLDPPPAVAASLALPFKGIADNYVIAELKRRGLYKQPGSSPGKHDITCPWMNEHTDQVDSGTGYIEPCAEYPAGGFNCFHGHCAGRTIKDLKAFLGLCQADDYSDPLTVAVTRLAKLPALQYDMVRRDEAKALGVRPGTLDDAVKSARKCETSRL